MQVADHRRRGRAAARHAGPVSVPPVASMGSRTMAPATRQVLRRPGWRTSLPPALLLSSRIMPRKPTSSSRQSPSSRPACRARPARWRQRPGRAATSGCRTPGRPGVSTDTSSVRTSRVASYASNVTSSSASRADVEVGANVAQRGELVADQRVVGDVDLHMVGTVPRSADLLSRSWGEVRWGGWGVDGGGGAGGRLHRRGGRPQGGRLGGDGIAAAGVLADLAVLLTTLRQQAAEGSALGLVPVKDASSSSSSSHCR